MNETTHPQFTQEDANMLTHLRLRLDTMAVQLADTTRRLSGVQEQLHVLQRTHAVGVLAQAVADTNRRLDQALSVIDRTVKESSIGVLAMATLWLVSARIDAPADVYALCPSCQEQYPAGQLIHHARNCSALLDDVLSDGPPRPPHIA